VVILYTSLSLTSIVKPSFHSNALPLKNYLSISHLYHCHLNLPRLPLSITWITSIVSFGSPCFLYS
jgi:hypothetical protein